MPSGAQNELRMRYSSNMTDIEKKREVVDKAREAAIREREDLYETYRVYANIVDELQRSANMSVAMEERLDLTRKKMEEMERRYDELATLAVHPETNDGKNGLSDELVSELYDEIDRKRLRKDSDDEISGWASEILKEEKARNKQIVDLSGNVKAAASGVAGILNNIVKLDLAAAVVSAQSGSTAIGNIFGDLAKEGIGKDLFADDSKFMQLFGRMKMGLGVATAILGTVGIAGELIDTVGNMNRTSLNQTGAAGDFGISLGSAFEQNALGFMTNLSAKDIEQIQGNLVRNRAKYGTQEYKEGLEFSVAATQQYGISASSASNLYVDAVLKGTMSVGALNSALNELQETVKNTDITMESALEDFTDTVNSMKGVSGSEGAATAAASEFEGLLGNSELASMAANKVNSASKSMGTMQFNARVAQYQEQNPGTTLSQAQLMVSEQYERMNAAAMYGSGDPRTLMAMMAITEDGRTFNDFVDAGDRAGLISALNNLETHSMPGINLGTIRSALALYGLDEKIINDNEMIADYLIGNPNKDFQGYGMRMTTAKNAIENGKKEKVGAKALDNEYVKLAVSEGYMTEEQAMDLTESDMRLLEQNSSSWAFGSMGFDPLSGSTYDNRSFAQYGINSILGLSDSASIAKYTRDNSRVTTVNGTVRIELKEDAKQMFYAYYEDENSRVIANAGER